MFVEKSTLGNLDQEWLNRKTKNGSTKRQIVQKRNSGTNDESVELFTSWQGVAKTHSKYKSYSVFKFATTLWKSLALDVFGVFVRNQLKVLQQSFPDVQIVENFVDIYAESSALSRQSLQNTK